MVQQTENANTTTTLITHGWVSSPDRRGTIDILKLCLATVFLCTFSVLFLNIKHCNTRLELIIYKTKWVIFTIFFPELTTAIAAERWRSARQSVAEFSRTEKKMAAQFKGSHQDQTRLNIRRSVAGLKETPWTARHAFFADMGGLRLRCPDSPDFPINSVHFLWLIENGHIEYPRIEEATIRDKNKADNLTRGVTIVQVTWFTIQVVARAFQHLYVTTLELSTLAFVCCTIHTFWFWRHKPLDVAEPMTIACDKEIRVNIGDAGSRVPKGQHFHATPLGFLDLEARTSYVDTFFFFMRVATCRENKESLEPISSFPNSAVSHEGIKMIDVIYEYVFGALYFGIHLIAWDFRFPSYFEMWLWRSSSIFFACMAALYEFGCWPGNYIGRYLLPGRPSTTIEIGRALPRRLIRIFMWPLL